MSTSFWCHCGERRRPAADRRWVVLQRRCNHSAFSGYRHTPSDYSEVACLSCFAIGRTKAAFVDALPDDHGQWDAALRANRSNNYA
jgi:hypothetical protein